jgi:hypothetical protein
MNNHFIVAALMRTPKFQHFKQFRQCCTRLMHLESMPMQSLGACVKEYLIGIY